MIKKLLTLLCAGLLVPAFSQDNTETNETPVPIVAYTATLKTGDKVQLGDAESINHAINQLRRNITSLKNQVYEKDSLNTTAHQALIDKDIELSERIEVIQEMFNALLDDMQAMHDENIERMTGLADALKALYDRVDALHPTNVIPPVQEFSEIRWNNGATELASREVVGSKLTSIDKIDPSFVHFVQARPLIMPAPPPSGVLPTNLVINLVTYPEIDVAFKGWNPEVPEFVPATNCTFNAVFEYPKFYNFIVKCQKDGTDYVILNHSFIKGESLKNEKTCFSVPGYTISFDPEIPDTMPASQFVTYVTFTEETPEEVTVHFNYDNGFSPTIVDMTGVPGAELIPPEPTKIGYIFQGWSVGSSGLEMPEVFPEEETTYIARYRNDPEFTMLIFTDDTKMMAKVEGAFDKTYSGETRLRNIVFGSLVSGIEAGAFRGCTGLRQIDMSNSQITSIGDNAFADCTDLRIVSLPNSIQHIGYDAFSGCPSSDDGVKLGGIYYTVGNWILKAKDTLVSNEDFTIKDFVGIADGAYSEIESLTSVALGTPLVYVGNKAFSNCPNLTQVSILQPTINNMGKNVFMNCSSLSRVSTSLPSTTVMSKTNFPWGLSSGTIIETMDDDIVVK